jgi:hypothetical protein
VQACAFANRALEVDSRVTVWESELDRHRAKAAVGTIHGFVRFGALTEKFKVLDTGERVLNNSK